MATKNYEASVLFKRNYASTAHIVINQGGTSSGKTYAIEQVLFCLACEKGKQVITIVGQDIPNLKAGAVRDALTIYNKSSQLKKLVKTFNKTDRIFEFYNGSLIEFKSYGSAQDAKSGKRDYLFINEHKELKGITIRNIIVTLLGTVSIVASVMTTFFKLKGDINEIRTMQDSQSRINELRLKVLENNVAVLQQEVRETNDKNQIKQ